MSQGEESVKNKNETRGGKFKVTIKIVSERVRIQHESEKVSIQKENENTTRKQSWARDNTAATTGPCVQATKLLISAIMHIFVAATPFRSRDLNIFRIFCCL